MSFVDALEAAQLDLPQGAVELRDQSELFRTLC
jgi:hypothetical protein